ncbi:MAG: tetratricopeptide repeat protein [Candidatus Latescibacteria bacterium]|nr:tetratricopeptide repeat protein [Candidatus Latescibacterota bacterium]
MRYLILNLWIILFLSSAGWTTSEVADSLSVLEAAVKAAPKDGDAWVVLGNLYLNAGEIEKADNAFRKGIRYAGSADAYVGLGRVFMARGRTRARQGLPYFRMARAKDP